MIIKNIINKLFKKNNINHSIINMNDAFILPKRSDFIDNEEIINLIDNKKEYYNNLLRNKKVFFTMEFNKELKSDILTRIDIILNEFLKSENKRLDTRVFISKLMLYYNDLIIYEKEVISICISLKEIINEKVFLSKGKKELLNNELNNLLNLLVILNSNKFAINTRINSYKTEYIYEQHEFSDEELNKRYEYLCYLKDIDINNNLDNNKKIIEIALIEKELEEYAYKNNDKIKDILNDINYMKDNQLIINIFDSKEEKESYNENKLIIENDERYLLIFKEFGRNLISEEIVEYFYQEKFKVITFNIYKNYCIDKNDKGYNYYLKIIEDKVNNILHFNNKKLDNYYHILNTSNNKQKESIIKFYKVLLINCEKNYEELYKTILKERLYLAFLLSIYDKEDLKDFYENYMIYASLYNNYKYNYLNNIISLKSLFDINKIFDNSILGIGVNKNWLEIIQLEVLEEIYDNYDFYKKDRANLVYRIPEGIRNIDTRYGDLFSWLNKFKYDIKKNILVTTITFSKAIEELYFPESLVTTEDSFFIDLPIRNIYINNNLIIKELSHSHYFNIHNIYINSKVENISESLFKRNGGLRKIIFSDFTNSVYLNEYLNKFIKSLIDYNDHYINDYKENSKIYVFFKIDAIYLESNNNEYKIDLTKMEKYITIFDEEKLINSFKEYFVKEVKSVTGYDIEDNKLIRKN